MQLSMALNALIDANLAVVVAVARDDHDHFDRLVAAVEEKREAVTTAGARYQRCLAQAGHGGEAEALAADLVEVTESAAPATTFAAAAPAAG